MIFNTLRKCITSLNAHKKLKHFFIIFFACFVFAIFNRKKKYERTSWGRIILKHDENGGNFFVVSWLKFHVEGIFTSRASNFVMKGNNMEQESCASVEQLQKSLWSLYYYIFYSCSILYDFHFHKILNSGMFELL